jgi:hypothetical protein
MDVVFASTRALHQGPGDDPDWRRCAIAEPGAADAGGTLARWREADRERLRRQSSCLSGQLRLAPLKRALAEGLPYQTLVSSVLHKYAAGRLKEV